MIFFFIKIKNFYPSKYSIKEMKRQGTQQEKRFTHHMPEKGCVSKIHKELSEPNNHKVTPPQWEKYFSGQFTKEDKQTSNEHFKICSTSWFIK